MTTNSLNIKISKKTVIFIVLAVFFVIADRFFKTLCLKGFFDTPIKLVSDVFSLHYVKNPYIAFSLPFSGPTLTALIGIIILILIIYWLKSLFSPNTRYQIPNTKYALTILIIGAILNLTDRIKLGFVVDYFDLKYFTIFNLADIMICGGIIWLIFSKKQ
jgi:signal peptidase II